MKTSDSKKLGQTQKASISTVSLSIIEWRIGRMLKKWSDFGYPLDDKWEEFQPQPLNVSNINSTGRTFGSNSTSAPETQTRSKLRKFYEVLIELEAKWDKHFGDVANPAPKEHSVIKQSGLEALSMILDNLESKWSSFFQEIFPPYPDSQHAQEATPSISETKSKEKINPNLVTMKKTQKLKKRLSNIKGNGPTSCGKVSVRPGWSKCYRCKNSMPSTSLRRHLERCHATKSSQVQQMK